jgi:membrane protease YdiL (CAAX protease family)
MICKTSTDYYFQYIRFLNQTSKMSVLTTKNCKENWLLISFVLLFSVAISGFYFLDSSELSNNSRSKEVVPLGILLLAGVFLAPIFEELAFRAAFLKQNIFIGISLVLMIGFVAMTYENYYGVAAFILFSVLFVAYKITNSMLIFKLVCVSNAVLFGLVHYTMDDFVSLDRGFIVLFQISIGFLLIWITINYSLVRSMVAHGIYNGIALSMMVYGLQFPDLKKHNYQDENIKVEWQSVAYFDSFTSSYTVSKDTIDVSNATIPNLYLLTDLKKSEKENTAVVPTDPYSKYNFKIILKKDAVNKDIKSATHTFLLKEKFVIGDNVAK